MTKILEQYDPERIRELSAANKKLRKHKERFELVIRGTNDGIWDWEIQEGKFYFSERWAKMLGYQIEEIEPTFHGWIDLVHPDDLGRFLLVWTEYMEGTTDQFLLEYRLKTISGEYLWVLGRAISQIDEEGFPYRMAGANTDIQARKAAEEILIQAKEAAEIAVKSQSQFMSAMSHEIRTPLNAIIGYSEFIKDEAAEGQKKAVIADAQKIFKAGSHLLRLVNQVLDMAKIENKE